MNLTDREFVMSIVILALLSLLWIGERIPQQPKSPECPKCATSQNKPEPPVIINKAYVPVKFHSAKKAHQQEEGLIHYSGKDYAMIPQCAPGYIPMPDGCNCCHRDHGVESCTSHWCGEN